MTLVARLLEATPPPPDAEPDLLLVEFARMIELRAQILADATRPTEPTEPAVLGALVARDHAWEAALQIAREAVGASRIGTSRMRRYL